MGTRLASRHHGTRPAIERAASRLFLKHGYRAVSMADIAAEAKVAKQTLYTQYGSKERLFEAILLRKLAEHNFGESAPHDEGCTVENYLLQLARNFFALITNREAMGVYRIMVAEGYKDAKLAAVFGEAGPCLMMTRLAEYLARQSERGTMKVEDCGIAAQQFFSLLKGEPHMRLLLNLTPQPTRSECDAYVASCVKMFLAAYAR